MRRRREPAERVELEAVVILAGVLALLALWIVWPRLGLLALVIAGGIYAYRS